MSFEVIDLDTDESQGKFDTRDEARACVRFNRLRAYAIWDGNTRVECCDPYTGDDDRIKQALGQPNTSEAEDYNTDPLYGKRMDSADCGEN